MKKNLDDPSLLSLRHKLSFLFKDSILYGGAAALNKAFSFITFPLLARHFSVDEYGLIDFFSVIAGLLGTFFIFGQDSAVARFFYEYKDDQSRQQLISQSLILQLIFVLVVLPIFWVFADFLAYKLSGYPNSGRLLKLIIFQVPFLVIVNFSQNLLKWTFSRFRFLIISLGSVFVNAAILLGAIYFYDIGVEGVFIISLIAKISFGLLGLYYVKGWLAKPKNFIFLKELVPYAIPFGVICCIGAFIPTFERGVINSQLGSHGLGLYAAGAKIAMMMTLVIQAFQTAWGPFSLAIYKEPDAAEAYNWVLKVFVVLMCVSVLILSAIGETVVHLMASARYAGAGIIVFPLSMGLVIQATSWITEIGINLSKRSYLGLYGHTMYLLTTAFSVFLFAKIAGFVGVAFGVMLGQIVKSVVASFMAQRAYPLPWAYRPIIIIYIFCIVIGMLCTWVSVAHNIMLTSILYGIGIIAISMLAWVLFFNPQERTRIRYQASAIIARFSG